MRNLAIVLFCVLVALAAVAKGKRSYLTAKISDQEIAVTCVAGTQPHLRMLSPTTVSFACYSENTKNTVNTFSYPEYLNNAAGR